MSRRFWTADLHLGHSNIIEYCDRPFRDCHHMNIRLIDDANMRLAPDDTCVCVGDFCVRGGQKARDWLAKIRGRWVFVRGNHDKNNGVKTVCTWMVADVGQYRAFVSHVPYFYCDPDDRVSRYHLGPALIEWVEANCNFAICGHIHEKWAVSRSGKIPSYNVGVDQHNFKPVSDDELIGIHTKEMATKTY